MAFSTPALARPAVSPIQEQPAERASAASTVAARNMGRCRVVSCLLLRNASGKVRARKALLPAEGRLRRPDCRNGSTVNISFFPVKTEALTGEEKHVFPARPARDGARGQEHGKRGQVRRRMTRLRQAGAGGRGEDGRPFFRLPPAYASPPHHRTSFSPLMPASRQRRMEARRRRSTRAALQGESGSRPARQAKPGEARQALEQRKARRQEVGGMRHLS